MIRRLAGVAVALLCAGGASPLSAQGGVPVIPARAFAYDTVPARLDSLFARVSRDTAVRIVRNGPQVVILTGPRRHLADSLPVWCRGGCLWEWDEIQAVPQEGAGYHLGATWGLTAIHADSAWALGATGRGQTVTALDSGIDPTHPGYVVAGGFNAVNVVFGGDGGTWYDDIPACNGHGTHTAGTAAGKTRGVAKDARVLGVKVFQLINGQCLSYTSSQVAGINWAVAQRTAAINISISGTSSLAMIGAVAAANAAGIPVCRANGNAGTNPPNGVDAEIQTASVGTSLTASGFSNYGPTTDLAAPGENVESTMPGGGYGTKSGTSMAAPHVCGAVALVKSVRPDLSADAVEAVLKATAQPLGTAPNDRTGYGLVRPDRAIAALALQGPSVVAAPRTYTTTQTECEAVNGTMPFTATTDAPWLTVWTTADRRVCWTADVSRAPVGTTTLPIYLAALAAPPVTGPTVTVDLATRYQTMEMWETSLRMWEQDKINDRFASSIETYNVAVANYLVDSVGINGVRVQIQSGLENPIDYWTPFVTGTMSYTVWSPSRYEKVNDNADPNVANLAGFQFAPFDYQMEKFVLPMKARLAARGESLHVNLNYLDFKWNAARQGTLNHAGNPAEFAEFVLVYFERMRDRYGITPDAFEVILEPENTNYWDGGAIGRGAVAVAARLAAAGFHPKFIVPSATAMDRAVPYFNAVMAVPGTAGLISMLAYHRYGGESEANAAAIRTTAASKGVRTGMLEKVGAGIDEWMEDITVANASAWQQWGMADESGHDDAGAYYARVVLGQPPATAISLASRTRLLAPVFRAVRRGAVRVGSTAADLKTAAFQNPDGRAVVVLRPRGSGAVTLLGLPVGTYQITFAPESGTPTTTTTFATGPLPIAFPGAGVTVVRGIP